MLASILLLLCSLVLMLTNAILITNIPIATCGHWLNIMILPNPLTIIDHYQPLVDVINYRPCNSQWFYNVVKW